MDDQQLLIVDGDRGDLKRGSVFVIAEVDRTLIRD